MEEVKTDIGFARAWVRLSLEKKCLSRHLKTLLSNQELLRNLYKRHAFLRSDDEKEYFVHYLLTLNALDYACFTASYTHTVLPYRVTIFPSRKFHANTTSANLWVTVSGTLAHTDKPLPIPKPSLEMVFKVNFRFTQYMHVRISAHCHSEQGSFSIDRIHLTGFH